MAARLLTQQAEAAAADAGAPASKRARKAAEAVSVANPLADDRFKAMFEEEDFAIDEASKEYQLLHPNVDKVRSRGRGGPGSNWLIQLLLAARECHVAKRSAHSRRIFHAHNFERGTPSGCWQR